MCEVSSRFVNVPATAFDGADTHNDILDGFVYAIPKDLSGLTDLAKAEEHCKKKGGEDATLANIDTVAKKDMVRKQEKH